MRNRNTREGQKDGISEVLDRRKVVVDGGGWIRVSGGGAMCAAGEKGGGGQSAFVAGARRKLDGVGIGGMVADEVAIGGSGRIYDCGW